jgi:hypothetical protein
MVSDLGLLTREGMEYFFPIFKDMQHIGDQEYKDPFPDLPFPLKPFGGDLKKAVDAYRDELVKVMRSTSSQSYR